MSFAIKTSKHSHDRKEEGIEENVSLTRVFKNLC